MLDHTPKAYGYSLRKVKGTLLLKFDYRPLEPSAAMSFGATATALGRSKPPDLSWFKETTDRAAVLRLYHAT